MRKEFYILLSVLIVVLVVAIALPFLLSGETTVTGENPEIETVDNITCKSNAARYPFLEQKLDELSYSAVVNMIFEEDVISILELRYDTEYVNEERTNEAFYMITSELNVEMSENGVDPSFAMNAKVTKNDNHVLMSLFARKDDLTIENERFLMVDNSENNMFLINRDELVENFKKQGFDCD